MAPIQKLQAVKTFRRQRVADLLDAHGKVGLSKLVDISAAYLWQMGKGTGKSARGVSDENAAKIESKLGKPPGWMDADIQDPSRSQVLRLDADMIAETHAALRLAYEEEGREYRIEDDPTRFVRAYELRSSLSAHPTQDEWVQYGRKLQAIIAPQGAPPRGPNDGSSADGAHQKRVAGRVRRKA